MCGVMTCTMCPVLEQRPGRAEVMLWMRAQAEAMGGHHTVSKRVYAFPAEGTLCAGGAVVVA
eukprot:3085741-Rhodomonas_salina.3